MFPRKELTRQWDTTNMYCTVYKPTDPSRKFVDSELYSSETPETPSAPIFSGSDINYAGNRVYSHIIFEFEPYPLDRWLPPIP